MNYKIKRYEEVDIEVDIEVPGHLVNADEIERHVMRAFWLTPMPEELEEFFKSGPTVVNDAEFGAIVNGVTTVRCKLRRVL